MRQMWTNLSSQKIRSVQSSNPLKEKCQMCEKQMPKHENVAKTKNTRIKFPNLESIKQKTHVNEDIN